MTFFNKLQAYLLAGISVLPMKIILSIFDLEQLLPLVVGIQGLVVFVVISCFNHKELHKTWCFITFLIGAVLSFFLAHIISDIISISANINIIELFSLILSHAFVSAGSARLSLSMNIGDILNPAPESSLSDQAPPAQGGTTSNQVPQAQPVATSNQPASSSETEAVNASNSSTTCSYTGLDISSNVAFANSLENKIMQIAGNKIAGPNGKVSVSIRELGMTKGSPSYNLLVNIMSNYENDSNFERRLNSNNYRNTNIWSNIKTYGSPGNSILEIVKKS